jgi:hypothetical protein
MVHQRQQQQQQQFRKGDRLRITGGSYVEHLFGTFIRYCGTKACVNVDDDIKAERNLHRSSIRAVNSDDERVHGYWKVNGVPVTASTKENDDGDNNDSIDDLLKELSTMRLVIDRMEERLLKRKCK